MITLSKERINLIGEVIEEGKVQLRQQRIESPDEGNILIRIKAAAICGGDIKLFQNKHPFVPLPAALGHEIAGEVIEVGPKVNKIKQGDRVVVEPIINCEKCSECLRGNYHLCEKLNFLYRVGAAGMALYVEVAEKWAHRLPDNISFEEGALIEPLAVALHAWKKSNVKLGETVCVFGCGPIGLLIIQLARANGCSRIIAVDIQYNRLDLANKLGATDLVSPVNGDVIEQVMSITSEKGVEVCFEAVGSSITLEQSIKVLCKNGRLTIVGLFPQSEITIPVNTIVQRELTVSGSQAYCWDFEDAILLAQTGKVDLKQLISHTLDLSELQQALSIATDSSAKAVKVICIPKNESEENYG